MGLDVHKKAFQSYLPFKVFMALLFERSLSICGLLSELHTFAVSQSYICSHCWRLFLKHLLAFLHCTRNSSCIRKAFANGNGMCQYIDSCLKIRKFDFSKSSLVEVKLEYNKGMATS